MCFWQSKVLRVFLFFFFAPSGSHFWSPVLSHCHHIQFRPEKVGTFRRTWNKCLDISSRGIAGSTFMKEKTES